MASSCAREASTYASRRAVATGLTAFVLSVILGLVPRICCHFGWLQRE